MKKFKRMNDQGWNYAEKKDNVCTILKGYLPLEDLHLNQSSDDNEMEN